jgi:hypothetical protein
VPEWLKILVMMIGLGGWLATVVVTLWQGKLPDAATLGIPAALVLALAPPLRIGRRRTRAVTRTADATSGAEES